MISPPLSLCNHTGDTQYEIFYRCTVGTIPIMHLILLLSEI